MNLEEMVVVLWRHCNFLRSRPNYAELEGQAQEVDKVASELARLGGLDFDTLVKKYQLI